VERAPIKAQTLDTDMASIIEPRDSIVARFGGNIDLIRSAAGGFGAQARNHMNRLAETLAVQDAQGAASALHAIKGSAGTVGAAALAQLASALERKLLDNGDDAHSLDATRAQLPRMEQLLASSADQLIDTFGPSHFIAKPDTSAPPLRKEDWRARLAAIVELLDASNLKAIALSESLSPHAPNGYREDFQHFLARVRALDFARASKIARDMLEQA
jgi:two-component system sensor histidine kinase/response regulator